MANPNRNAAVARGLQDTEQDIASRLAGYVAPEVGKLALNQIPTNTEDSSLFSRTQSLPEAKEPASPIELSGSQTFRLKPTFQRTNSVLAAEESMKLIMQLKASIVDMDSRASQTLASCQTLMDACGEAIKEWFKGLSGPALERAIKQAFDKFDEDGSGLLEMNEFAKAMHTLGLRLKRPEYKILFDEYDIDGNGTIDLPEFTHMVKKYLKLPCEENDCLPCHGSDGSNQPRAVYRKKWVDDETLLDPAAAVLQKHIRSAVVREENGFHEDFVLRLEHGESRPYRDVGSCQSDSQSLVGESLSIEDMKRRKKEGTCSWESEQRQGSSQYGLHERRGLASREQSGLLESVQEDEEGKGASKAGNGEEEKSGHGNDMEEGGHRSDEWIGQNEEGGSQQQLESLAHTAEILRQFGASTIARTSSAPGGENADAMLLSAKEAARAWQVSDDSNHEHGRRSALRGPTRKGAGSHRFFGRNAIRDGHELMLKQMLRMKGQPNLNLNHDFDQFIWREGPRAFLDLHGEQARQAIDLLARRLERSNEQLDESEAQRENRTERFAIVDPWPGHLPPLAHGIYLPREGMGVVDSKQERGGSKSSEIRKPTSFLEPLCWKRGGLGNSILPVIAGGGPSDKLAPVQISPNALLKLPHDHLSTKEPTIERPRRSLGEQILLKSVRHEYALSRVSDQAQITQVQSVSLGDGLPEVVKASDGDRARQSLKKQSQAGSVTAEEADLPANWKMVPSRSRPGQFSFVHVPTGLKQSKLPTCEPSEAAVAAFKDATRNARVLWRERGV